MAVITACAALITHTHFYKPDTEISKERLYLIFCVCCLTVAEEQLDAAHFLSAVI